MGGLDEVPDPFDIIRKIDDFIVLKTLQLDLGDIIARLNPLFSLKL